MAVRVIDITYIETTNVLTIHFSDGSARDYTLVDKHIVSATVNKTDKTVVFTYTDNSTNLVALEPLFNDYFYTNDEINEMFTQLQWNVF